MNVNLVHWTCRWRKKNAQMHQCQKAFSLAKEQQNRALTLGFAKQKWLDLCCTFICQKYQVVIEKMIWRFYDSAGSENRYLRGTNDFILIFLLLSFWSFCCTRAATTGFLLQKSNVLMCVARVCSFFSTLDERKEVSFAKEQRANVCLFCKRATC